MVLLLTAYVVIFIITDLVELYTLLMMCQRWVGGRMQQLHLIIITLSTRMVNVKIQQILTVIIMMITMMKVMGVMLMSDSRNGGW